MGSPRVKLPPTIKYKYRCGEAFVSEAAYRRLSRHQQGLYTEVAGHSKDVEGYDLRGWTKEDMASLPSNLNLDNALFGRAPPSRMPAADAQSDEPPEVVLPHKIKYRYRHGNRFVSEAVYEKLSRAEQAKCIELSSEEVEGYDLRGWSGKQIARLPRDANGHLPLGNAVFGSLPDQDEHSVAAGSCVLL